MIRELDSVVLNVNRPELGLLAGDVGTVVHVYGGGEAFEVEFVTLAGETLGVLTLQKEEIRPVDAGDLAHVRRLRGAA